MKKVFFVCVSILSFVLILYAYSINNESQHLKLTILGEDSSNLKAYQTLTEGYYDHTGIDVSIEGDTFEQSLQKSDADFRNNSGYYDIVLQYNFSLSPYVNNGYVINMHDIFSEEELTNINDATGDLFQGALKETSFYYKNPKDSDSKISQFGFPFAANTMLLVYNKDIFEDKNIQDKFYDLMGRSLTIPKSWDEYLEVARFFSNNTDIDGVVVQGASGGWLYYELANYLFSIGTGTSNKKHGWEKNKEITINTRKNVKALNYFKELTKNSAGDFFTVGASQQQEMMLQGKAAMSIMWSDYLYPMITSDKDVNFGFSPIPGNVSGLAGGAFYVNKDSQNVKMAGDFIAYALTKENQEKLILKGLCSAVRSAYTPKVMKEISYAHALKDSLDRGVFMFEAAEDSEIVSSVLTENVQKFIRGNYSAEETLKKSEEDIINAKTKLTKK